MISPFGTLRQKYSAPDLLVERLHALEPSLARIEADPHTMWLAYDITRHLTDDQTRFHAIVWLVLLFAARSEGSTCLPYGKTLHPQIVEKIRLINGAEQPWLNDTDLNAFMNGPDIHGLLGGLADSVPMIRNQGRVYIQQTFREEAVLIQALLARAGGQELRAQDLAQEWHEVLKGVDPKPGPEQVAAIQSCLLHPFSVVSGGPGTGKTTGVVLHVMRALLRLDVKAEDIAIAAPTGKAANRMGEAIKDGLTRLESSGALTELDRTLLKIEAKTIHRLLGGFGRKRKYHSDFPLRAKIVIVDEASMIDVELMNALLAATPNSQMVLIGDPDQLPSVSVGAVFKDVLKTRLMEIPRAHLTVSHRMESGSEILNFAKWVNNPAGADHASARPFTNDLPTTGVAIIDPRTDDEQEDSTAYSPGELREFLDAWFKTHVALAKRTREVLMERPGEHWTPESEDHMREIFAHWGDAKLLCLTRGGQGGALRVNAELHRLFTGKKSAHFEAGEPVMMLRNDYNINVFNGDQGVVLKTRLGQEEKPKLRVVFKLGQKFEAFEIQNFEDSLELSYAMTVHKSQGSEFSHVGVVLPTQDIPLLTREIIYTGVTRAKKSVVIFGAPELLKKAADTPTYRFSGLVDISWDKPAAVKKRTSQKAYRALVERGTNRTIAEGRTVKALYTSGLRFLVENSLLQDVNLPYASGSKRNLISRTPIHVNGTEFVSPVEYEGYFMESHKGNAQAVDEFSKFLNHLGISVDVEILDATLMTLERFINGMHSQSPEVYDFVRRMAERVDAHPQLTSRFATKYWDICIGHQAILRINHSHGGSFSISELVNQLQKLKGPKATHHLVHSLADLSPSTTVIPRGALQVWDTHIHFHEVLPHEDRFWEIIEEFIQGEKL